MFPVLPGSSVYSETVMTVAKINRFGDRAAVAPLLLPAVAAFSAQLARSVTGVQIAGVWNCRSALPDPP